MNLEDFKGCVIVMAHPDDEMLWASSLLANAKKIILCYAESPGSHAVTEGRRASLRDFPLKTVVNLDITESQTYQTSSWRRPVENEYGVLCGRNEEAYARNFHILHEALQNHLDKDDIVVTHNPWGEYGHEEHVQVYRAVSKLRQQRRFRLFVTGYVSDRVIHLMERNTSRLGKPSSLLPVDKSLCRSLKQLYQKNGCWTWDDHYEWPDYECFYEVVRPDAPLRMIEKTVTSPLVNVIWLDGQLPFWHRLARRFKRRLLNVNYNSFLPALALLGAL